MELVMVVKRQGLKAPEEAFQVHTLQDKNDAFSTSDLQFPTSRPCTNKKEEVQSACEYIIMRKKKKVFLRSQDKGDLEEALKKATLGVLTF